MKKPAKTDKKQDTKFKPGVSGNKKGRPQGSRNLASIACQNLLDNEGEALTRKAIELAQNGDMVALRLCLERLVPTRKDSPVLFDLPSIDTPADLSKATATVAKAVSTGALTPVEGELVSKCLERHCKALELTDIEQRIRTLEQKA